jgi:hypothetical protein
MGSFLSLYVNTIVVFWLVVLAFAAISIFADARAQRRREEAERERRDRERRTPPRIPPPPVPPEPFIDDPKWRPVRVSQKEDNW